MNKQDLINFTNNLIPIFESGKIKAPVHFSLGNEDQLIEIFKKIKKTDTVLSTWRSHYHALLHGVSPIKLKKEILLGNSITLCFPENNFITSAIVGGIAPIAVGIALGNKLQNTDKKVWCFLGDMASEMGIVHEAKKYAINFNLPVTFITEINNLSVDTPVYTSWGYAENKSITNHIIYDEKNKSITYTYERTLPHMGSGKWIRF